MATQYVAAPPAAGPPQGDEKPLKDHVSSKVAAQTILRKIDEDETFFSWKIIQTIIAAGGGFMVDAYDLFVIGLLTKLIGRIYYPDALQYAPSDLPNRSNYALASVALIGTLVGQLTFGHLADLFGRKPVHIVTMVIISIAALCSGMSFGTTGDAVVGTLCMWRFLLGLGIGGIYPLSATVMSETASTKYRGTYISAVFAFQGFGFLLAGTVVIILAAIWMPYPDAGDFLWRTAFALASVPPCITLYYRMIIPETERYEVNVKGDIQTAAKQLGIDNDPTIIKATGLKAKGHTWRSFLDLYGLPLMGCAFSWFLLDIAFYSQGLFQSDVFSIVGWLPAAYTMNAIEETYRIARAQLIISLASIIPGYWFTVATIEIMGRTKIQYMGFFFMTLFMGILAGLYDQLKGEVSNFIALYALTFFFSNWGPNSTTYVLPAEVFPSWFRATAHGICAATGKAGAIVGSYGFGILKDTPKHNAGLKTVLIVLTIVNALGLLTTIPIPETKGKTLEELGREGEDMSSMHTEESQDEPSSAQNVSHTSPFKSTDPNGKVTSNHLKVSSFILDAWAIRDIITSVTQVTS
ncbi:hypothetical protein GUITHDRAFT_158082 [Guillardia theta CCMP2712]|uniref:Major facilitator superfamily (MFS) profile domain-containing protein n=1 Tax=Guillardia theta (strain CCMP2712) TaxID=905079 RepID=L1J3C0_GUITC|nr:hypothetical protein GUITHDRAFT_158082 [Guillardia theta CCMP2712]EKX43011.1 hypothetical protein GUITHDRAFT_158082 [Guillardia theta CCMP2712]|eukprot:XP_005829991.1 hypothetical protein GUITHDRAFT_158082 [Guillardia theta CCMP2712]